LCSSEHVCVFLDEKEPDELDMTNYMTIPYQPISASTVEITDAYLVSIFGERATQERPNPDVGLYSYLSRSTPTM